MKFMFLILIMVSSPKSNQYIFTTFFEKRDQGQGRQAGRFCIYVWVAFPYFGLKIAVGDLLRPWLCFIQLIIIIFFQGEWRKRRLDDQKFSLLFAIIWRRAVVLKFDDKNFSIVNWHDFLPQICRRSIAK